MSSATEAAVLQALFTGRDASGRFVDAVTWLGEDGPVPAGRLEADALLLPFAAWPRWEQKDTAPSPQRILVLHESIFLSIGFLFLVFVGLSAWRYAGSAATWFGLQARSWSSWSWEGSCFRARFTGNSPHRLLPACLLSWEDSRFLEPKDPRRPRWSAKRSSSAWR